MSTEFHNKWVRITYFTIKKMAREKEYLNDKEISKLVQMSQRCMKENAGQTLYDK